MQKEEKIINSSAPHQAGFTLVEIIAVLMLLGIISAIAVSKIGKIHSATDLVTETEILKNNLRFAQVRAMNSTYDDIWRISFTSTGYVMQQYDSAAGTWNNKIMPSEMEGASDTRTFPSGVSVSSGPSAVRFDSWGIPVQADFMTPEAADITIILTDGTQTRTITVTENTGYIP